MDSGLCLTLCRSMHPGDANIAGNVHGGTILKMIEEAGLIVSTRHCNLGNKENIGPLCALVRVEKTDFLQPMYVGEIAHLCAEVTYCAEHSLEVKATVQAENLFTGVKRLTNKATLWYVPVIRESNSKIKVCKVPPMEYASKEAEEAGRARYMKQKGERQKVSASEEPTLYADWITNIQAHTRNSKSHTVSNAQSTLIHAVGVEDCGMHDRVTGGVTMKLMDEAAGICAVRHCRSGALTASMDAVDFHQSIMKGSLLHIRSRPIFTSDKSLLIQVVVMVEQHRRDSSEAVVYCACTAFFTFVSISGGKILPIPPLQLLNDDERARFEEGKKRYERNKQERKSSMSPSK